LKGTIRIEKQQFEEGMKRQENRGRVWEGRSNKGTKEGFRKDG